MDAQALIVEALREAAVVSLSAEPDFEKARQRMVAILSGHQPDEANSRMVVDSERRSATERRRGIDRRSVAFSRPLPSQHH